MPKLFDEKHLKVDKFSIIIDGERASGKTTCIQLLKEVMLSSGKWRAVEVYLEREKMIPKDTSEFWKIEAVR